MLFAAARSDNRYFLGGALIALGVAGLAFSLTQGNEELRRHARETAGPGWWLGRLSSKLPGAGARIAFTVLSIAIIALGLFALLAG